MKSQLLSARRVDRAFAELAFEPGSADIASTMHSKRYRIMPIGTID
jgi:hypothetical protein